MLESEALPESHRRAYEFGAFRLDPAEKSLRRDGRPVALTPKVFETLLALVEHSGHLMTKEDLLQRVWADSFVEEASLAQNISVLRKIFGEDPHEPRFIETVPKRGYRFIGSVTRRDLSDPAGVDSPAPTAPATPHPTARNERSRTGHWARFRLPVLALTAVVLGGSYFGVPAPPERRVLVAVLPFVNMTGDSSDEYVSEGLTEELITQLGRLEPGRLGVIARTSASHYKTLGVGYVIEGSVRREGTRIRVSARLTHMPEGTVVWTEAYDQNPLQILTLESRVARSVAEQLQTRLDLPRSALPVHAGTRNPEAYALYVRARYFWNKRVPEMAAKGIALYQQAIAADPGFAQAYAELSRCYLSSPSPDGLASYRLAEETARKGLAIDDNLGAAHFALASAALHLFDWATATREFARAEALDPTLRNVDYMVIFGRFDEAIAETRRGLELDPVNLLVRHGAGINAFFARRYQQAVDHYQQALELDPTYVYSQVRLGQAYAELRRYDDAVKVLEQAGVLGLSQLGYIYGITGRRAEALDVLRRMAEWSPTGLGLDRAVVYAALGNKEEAFRRLNAAYEERAYQLIYLKVDPRFDVLRGDPRFADLVRRIGFPAA